MADIKAQKLLYHLTSLDNVPAILDQGLLPRSQVKRFTDVADGDILKGREGENLQDFVPFHFFAKNPFDGRVQKDHPEKEFVLFAVRRTLAKGNEWKIIPRHPLSNAGVQVLDYDEGFEAIDWAAMGRRDYHDELSKSVCMAECLSPGIVRPEQFCLIYVASEATQEIVEKAIRESSVDLGVTVNPNMFVKS